ncbi:tripartite tricarboxylate transporter TctB family protein [Acuticoccus sp. MNP-M23]|uniref:tripartite tricarboxylate transporter TctB family protein n=1 Tax=Acuticoccus sp. MNP-M23 TaxID=3072793 RepID=UPI00281677A5|nr:tripartite tricarboxylate transporter TctB family protein [Acuticoccus sp. MNP-M23]WMS44672.1 tripartite tricarboxylate transporter TctB family protein [Acuticoccus sp. MNP-M23]
MGRLVVALAAIGLVFFMWGEASAYPATARKLPDLLGWVVMVLAVLAIAQQALQWRKASANGTLGTSDPINWQGVALGAAFVGLIVAYAWSIGIIGYLIATPLFLTIPLVLLRPVGLLTGALTIIAVTAVIYGVFVWFLRLNIPLYPAF